MSFYICNGLGESIDTPSPEQMQRFILAIDASDEEHGAAWLSTDDGWSLEWNGDGRLVLSAGARAPVRHIGRVSRARALELWGVLAAGDVAALEREAWQPGNGIVSTPAQEARLQESQIQDDRRFYGVLGAERPEERCRRTGCTRGSVEFSVLCRVHHFESIRGRPSPFDD